MSWFSALAIYFILWWLVLFAVLPWGVKSPDEAGETVEAGHAPSAPVNPRLGAKFAVTTLIAAVLFGFVYWLLVLSGIGFDDIPFLPKPRV